MRSGLHNIGEGFISGKATTLHTIEQGFVLAKAVDGAAPIAYSFGSGAGDPAPANPVTFSGMSLGTAAADRYILTAIYGSVNANRPLTGLTVDGIAASIAATLQDGSNGSINLCISANPSNTTGDVVATYSSTQLRIAAATVRLTGLGSTAAANTNSVWGGSDASRNLDVVVPEGGIIIAAAARISATDPTWTNVTQIGTANSNEANVRLIVAASGPLTAGTVNVVCNPCRGLLVASFPPT